MKYSVSFYYLFLLIVFLITYETIHALIRQRQRYQYYQLAERRSKAIGKKLLVVGDPYAGHGTRLYSLFMKNYKCGDITIDLTGAPKCENNYKTDILTFLQKQPTNSLVIYISCVLEYVDEMDEVIKEIYRVSGTANNIFIVTVNKYTLSSLFYRDKYSKAKRVVYAPPAQQKITYVNITI